MNHAWLAITAGEPAGIGPDLLLQLIRHPAAAHSVLLADTEVLSARAAQLGHTVQWMPWTETAEPQALPDNHLWVAHHPVAAPVIAGQLNRANAAHVLALLETACAGCLSGRFAAMVTAPVHKGVINDAGVPFSGHTEWLAERTGTPLVVMMLVGSGMRVALATTHLPLRAVADAITPEGLAQVLRITYADLQQKFGIRQPRLLVAGLNPHAGEGGHLGREELDVIIPVLTQLRQEGMDLVGPLPADTLFQEKYLQQADAVLAMYHDQGLPVLKHASFGQGVNITLGLPIIRTSVDHGTALDLAGRGQAEAGSLWAAVDLAWQLVKQRQQL